MFKLMLLSLASAVQALVIGGVARAPVLHPRVAAPVALAPETASLAATVLVADDIDPVVLASSGGFLLFVFLVVGTVIVNFGIRK